MNEEDYGEEEDDDDEALAGTILYIAPAVCDKTYRYPSGSTCKSVIAPNPEANHGMNVSSALFATLSASGPVKSKPSLCLFNLKWYIFPKITSATNTSFSYCFPSLEELRNLIAVGPIVCSHVN